MWINRAIRELFHRKIAGPIVKEIEQATRSEEKLEHQVRDHLRATAHSATDSDLAGERRVLGTDIGGDTHHRKMEVTDRSRTAEAEPGSMRLQSTLEATIGQLGSEVAEESLIVGSTAMHAAFGSGFRKANDIDMSVPDAVYRHLRRQPGWSEVRVPGSDRFLLVNGDFEVGIGWGGKQTHEALASRAWRTPRTPDRPSGIPIASLSDVRVWKDLRRSEKDLQDLAWSRARLLDPKHGLLPSHVISHEERVARSIVRDDVLNHPDAPRAFRLAGNALHSTNAVYGHGDIGHIFAHFGEKELIENGGAFSGYHNGFYLPNDMRYLQQHMELKGFSAADRLAAMAADNYSDLNFCDGRGLDELRSANLFRSHAELVDYSPGQVDRGTEAILGTKFDEEKRIQSGTDHEDPLVRAVVGVDLQGTSEAEGYLRAVNLGPENLTAVRVSAERPLGRMLAEENLQLHTVEDMMETMQEHRRYRPIINGVPAKRTLGEAMINHIEGQVSFLDPKTPFGRQPHDWSLRRPEVQQSHSNQAAEAAQKLRAGQTFPEFYEEAKSYTEKTRDKFKL